jgi:hypothetical protein
LCSIKLKEILQVLWCWGFESRSMPKTRILTHSYLQI